MKSVASTLVVDAAILVAAILGRNAGAFLDASKVCRLVTTDRAVVEVSRRIELGLGRPELLDILEAVLSEMTVVPVSTLADDIPRAEIVLRDSVPSRNGSTSDAHILALSWAVDADIWTHDRDFAGAGVASWSTPNLVRALGREN
jgi:predicted nucleic acid-binding protein